MTVGKELPDEIRDDIDETFCYREDVSYQSRSHDYLEKYEVARGWNDTAVQAVVTDLAIRAYEAGMEAAEAGAAAFGQTPMPSAASLAEISGELIEAAAKCMRACSKMGGAECFETD